MGKTTHRGIDIYQTRNTSVPAGAHQHEASWMIGTVRDYTTGSTAEGALERAKRCIDCELDNAIEAVAAGTQTTRGQTDGNILCGIRRPRVVRRR